MLLDEDQPPRLRIEHHSALLDDAAVSFDGCQEHIQSFTCSIAELGHLAQLLCRFALGSQPQAGPKLPSWKKWEHERATEAEAEVERLRAELARLQGK